MNVAKNVLFKVYLLTFHLFINIVPIKNTKYFGSHPKSLNIKQQVIVFHRNKKKTV